VADLHADLLAFVAGGGGRDPHDPQSRVSVDQLALGGVTLQVLPVYTHGGPGSVAWGAAQVAAYPSVAAALAEARIGTRLAVENASGFFAENEAFDLGIARLHAAWENHGIAYLSLTWAPENRFGGGNGTDVGLTPDGEFLMGWLVEHEVPLDLSHTCDRLAWDMIEFLDREAPGHVVVASHSNFRAVCEHPRNLPDDLALEVKMRGGVIGLNLCRAFVGPRPQDAVEHVNYALSLGLDDVLCLGTDFFSSLDLPEPTDHNFFFDGFDTAVCHPRLAAILREGGISDGMLLAVQWENLRRWLGAEPA
jgi:microsomal dipeptidase-like Zn-dependent dipeptidase